MKKIVVDDIRQRVEEVKALFVLGQKIMPVLEDIFQFIYEMHPVIEEINSSIKESSSKMPKASDKIINISNATELATSEILDYVDEIFKTSEYISQNYKENVEQQSQIFKKLVVDLNEIKNQSGNPEKIDEILSYVKKLYNVSLSKKVIQKNNDEWEKLNILANKILMALQFQDITSQQLQAANYLIAQVQNKLGNLLNKLGDVEVDTIAVNEQEFNENAEFTHDAEKQKIADELEEEFKNQEISEQEVMNQDEIDEISQALDALENNNLDNKK